MEWLPDLELAAEAVVARPYRLDDAEALHSAARESTAEIYPWLPWCHPNYQRRESEEWVGGCQQRWMAGESYDFAVLGKATGRFLGGCSLNQFRLDNRFANLGYWVRSSATGRGVATAALRLVAGFGFSRLGLRRIEVVAAENNVGSLRVAEKAGCLREGLLRNRLFLHGEPHDAVMFSLVSGDLRA